MDREAMLTGDVPSVFPELTAQETRKSETRGTAGAWRYVCAVEAENPPPIE
jgi:hypothetical protein